jgi:dienelactone hydrolase
VTPSAAAAEVVEFERDGRLLPTTLPGREFNDVAEQPADLRFVLAHLLADPRFDGRRVAGAGFSLGAVTAVAAAFERSKGARVKAVIAVSGRTPAFCACDFGRCPLLVVHGRLDDVVPYGDGLALYDRAAPPKALLTIELPGHQHYVENEPPSPGDAVVDTVTTAFLDRVLHASDDPAPAVDASVGSLEGEGVW